MHMETSTLVKKTHLTKMYIYDIQGKNDSYPFL